MATADELSFEDASQELVALRERTRVGRYELCYELGAGGMASVYLARMKGPGGFAKAVAIKRIHPHLSRKQSIVTMFLDEARIASMIDHPNVCSVLDFGEAEGDYFLAMEYLVGESMAAIMRRAQTDDALRASERWRRVMAHVIMDVGRGLHAAHELVDEAGRPMNLVHRDVTPHNLFLTYNGIPKLMDFGVAWASQRITQTTTGTLKGKFAYMAPEQIRKQPFDRRADVWALGVCLWEALTLRRLFRKGSDVDTLMAIERAAIPAPSKLVPEIEASLDAIVLRALRRDPDARYRTALELVNDLRDYLASGPPIDVMTVSEVARELGGEGMPEKLDIVQNMLTVATPVSTSGVSLRLPDLPTAAEEGSPFRRWAPWLGALFAMTLVFGGVAAVVLSPDAPEPPRLSEPESLEPSVAPESPRTSRTEGEDIDQAPAVDQAVDLSEPTPPPNEVTERAEESAQDQTAEPSRGARMRRETGMVTVIAIGGWGELHQNGRWVQLPRTVTLPAGTRTIRVRDPRSGEVVRQRVEVRAGESTRAAVRLE